MLLTFHRSRMTFCFIEVVSLPCVYAQHVLRRHLPQLLDDVNEAMVELRHDLHAHPELAFQEHRTTRVVRDRLTELGWELKACPTETGAVAVLRGAKPGRRIMIRADIDGLPVAEENQISFASVNAGVMHACGHDVHTAGLLGIADLLSRRQDDLAGEFTLLFQPAEEALGGAVAMIEGGVLTDNPVDLVIGAHVSSLAPLGFVGTEAGRRWMMGRGRVTRSVHMRGKGGHGAMASVEGNVILAVSHLAPRLGEVVDGLSFEGTSCACAAGVINAGTAMNVVPRHAVLRAGRCARSPPEQHVEALDRLRSSAAGNRVDVRRVLLTRVDRSRTGRCQQRRRLRTGHEVRHQSRGCQWRR